LRDLRHMKIIGQITILTMLLAAGCSQHESKIKPHSDIRLLCCSGDSITTATNWVTLATGEDIQTCPYTIDTNKTATIRFRFRNSATKRIIRTLLDNPDMTRFRIMRDQGIIADFDYDQKYQIGSCITVYIKTTPQEAKRIIREIRK